jgi:hypothetical protein
VFHFMVRQSKFCEVWGSQSNAAENADLLECGVLSVGEWVAAFRRNVVRLSSEVMVRHSTKDRMSHHRTT